MSRPSNKVLLVALACLVVVAVAVAVALSRDPSTGSDVAGSPTSDVSGTSGDDPDDEDATTPSSSSTAAPSGTSSGPSPSTASVPPVDPDVPAERVLFCDIDPVQIRNLLAPAGGEPDPPAALRDAVPLLGDRLAEWRSGAVGLTGAEEQLAIVQEVLDEWQQALTDYDTGDQAAGDSSIAAAEVHIQDLEAVLADGEVVGC